MMKKCLVVDDLPFNTQVLDAQLSHLGHQVDCCFSGTAAITACKNVDYDVIFMDIEMPTMSGIQAAQTILESNLTSPPIIFAISGHETPDNVPACFQKWLTKPISKHELQTLLSDSA